MTNDNPAPKPARKPGRDILGLIEEDNLQAARAKEQHLENPLVQQSNNLTPFKSKPLPLPPPPPPVEEKLYQTSFYHTDESRKNINRLVAAYNMEHGTQITKSDLDRYLWDRYGNPQLLEDFHNEQLGKKV
jgi:hypothetical protein